MRLRLFYICKKCKKTYHKKYTEINIDEVFTHRPRHVTELCNACQRKNKKWR